VFVSMLPEPICKYGYPTSQVDRIMGSRMKEFNNWMAGQTITMCDGREYDHAKKEYIESGCGPHGFVIYSWDVQRFLEGKPIID
jgi:hypothetical protein